MFAEAITLRGGFRRLLSLRPCRDGGCGLTLELEMDAIFSNRQLSYEHDKATLGHIQQKQVRNTQQIQIPKARLGHNFVCFHVLSLAVEFSPT